MYCRRCGSEVRELLWLSWDSADEPAWYCTPFCAQRAEQVLVPRSVEQREGC